MTRQWAASLGSSCGQSAGYRIWLLFFNQNKYETMFLDCYVM
jgi:hypothetical protein